MKMRAWGSLNWALIAAWIERKLATAALWSIQTKSQSNQDKSRRVLRTWPGWIIKASSGLFSKNFLTVHHPESVSDLEKLGRAQAQKGFLSSKAAFLANRCYKMVPASASSRLSEFSDRKVGSAVTLGTCCWACKNSPTLNYCTQLLHIAQLQDEAKLNIPLWWTLATFERFYHYVSINFQTRDNAM